MRVKFRNVRVKLRDVCVKFHVCVKFRDAYVKFGHSPASLSMVWLMLVESIK